MVNKKRYAGVVANDFINGIGVSVSFWCQGCKFHCKNCHNQHLWNHDEGYELSNNYIDQIIELLDKNNIHRNLSILGGEPLETYNIEIVYDLIKKVKELKKDTIKVFIWTGYLYEQIHYKDIFNYIDILIDGLFDYNLYDATLKLKGSTNQRIIDVQKTLKNNNQIVLYDNI